jgi:hypothetical protein
MSQHHHPKSQNKSPWRCKSWMFTIIVLWMFFALFFLQKHSMTKTRRKKLLYLKSIDYECANSSAETSVERVFLHYLKFKLYILAHDDFSYEIASKWSRCMPFAEILRIPTTMFFESIIYKELLPSRRSDWADLDFVGVATYKSLKFVSLEKLKAYLELGFHLHYDIVPLYATGEPLVSSFFQSLRSIIF